MADCLRMIHPNDLYRRAAADCCLKIGPFVEELNTNLELYNASVIARDGFESQLLIDKKMDSVDKRVLNLFIADFELSGVQLKDSNRHAQFVRNALTALQFSSQFVQVMYIA